MTRSARTPATPANRHGWRISRIPGRPVHRLDDGHIALPLWLARNNVQTADVELLMTTAEAEGLHAALCYLLADEHAPHDAPACRLTPQQAAARKRMNP